MIKKLLLVILAMAIIGGGIAYYLWNKPHEKVEDINGLTVSASQLCKDFSTDEVKANAKYIGKVLEVNGIISEVQNGKVVVLEGQDETSSVQCNMRDSGIVIKNGQMVTIKGFFADNSMFGPTLTDCVLKN